MKIKFLAGLPGSGKSTWAREFVSKNKDWVIVNRDSLRNMRGEYWIPKQEDMITDWENQCCLLAFKHGLNVILDATNLNRERNAARYDLFKKDFPDLQMEGFKFDVPVEECIKRDLQRPNSVGEKVIRDFYNKYLAPPKVKYREPVFLPKCIIVDIDGTVANKGSRSPYDWMKVEEDTPKGNIIDIVKTLYNRYKIIFFSGRDGVCEELTRSWLVRYYGAQFELYMRAEGDNRKDSIVKKELFEEHIRGKYYCEAVIDDRQQVVDMWRNELGLTCLQVDYGDF